MNQPINPSPALVDRLVREFGLTPAEAREIVATLGSDWSSLAREARTMKAGRR